MTQPTKRLLITGFDPFGGETVNPSWEAVRLLPEAVGAYRLTKLQIPTVFGQAAETVLTAARELRPDVILCIGQAGGRSAVTPEVVAINLREARIPDNAGHQPVNVPVVENAPAAYFSTVPIRTMVKAIQDAGLPAALSYSAGTLSATMCCIRSCTASTERKRRSALSMSPFCRSRQKGAPPAYPSRRSCKR